MLVKQIPIGFSRCTPSGIAKDGQVVVGSLMSYEGYWTAFVWHVPTDTLVIIPTVGGRNNRALGVSLSGEVVVGWSDNHRRDQIAFFAYMQDATIRSVTPIHPSFARRCVAFSVSGDGRYICGSYQHIIEDAERPFMYQIDEEPDDPHQFVELTRVEEGRAMAISEDGSFVVCEFFTPEGRRDLRLWSASIRGFSVLATPQRCDSCFSPRISLDGSLVVGRCMCGGSGYGVLWDRNTQTSHRLPIDADFEPKGVSNNPERVIVGHHHHVATGSVEYVVMRGQNRFHLPLEVNGYNIVSLDAVDPLGQYVAGEAIREGTIFVYLHSIV